MSLSDKQKEIIKRFEEYIEVPMFKGEWKVFEALIKKDIIERKDINYVLTEKGRVIFSQLIRLERS